MNFSITLIVQVSCLLLLSACGRRAPDTGWADGNFKLYEVDDGPKRVVKLGFDHHPGLLELVPGEVVAAGSDRVWIVVERLDPVTKATGFYIIKKEVIKKEDAD